jgi:Na+-transporting methylmalonyl-CoA/oxaloacetate decarboxylase gamma subunit
VQVSLFLFFLIFFIGFVMVRTRKKSRREAVQEECAAEAAEPLEKEVSAK